MTDVTPFDPPAIVAEQICDILKDDEALSQMTTGADGKTRNYPRDLRAVGWGSTPEVFDQDGLMLLSLCVDDAGGGPRVDAPHMLATDVIYIWAFSTRGEQGHREIAAALTRCFSILHHSTRPVGFVSCGNRIGIQDSDDDSFDRMSMQITGDFLSAV